MHSSTQLLHENMKNRYDIKITINGRGWEYAHFVVGWRGWLKKPKVTENKKEKFKLKIINCKTWFRCEFDTK